MNHPCIVVATFVPLPNQYEAVKKLLLEVAEDVYEEKGCITYALHEEINGALVFIEKWESRELWQQHSELPTVARIKNGVEGRLREEILVQEMYGAGNATSPASYL